jgi:hypothetical protein
LYPRVGPLEGRQKYLSSREETWPLSNDKAGGRTQSADLQAHCFPTCVPDAALTLLVSLQNWLRSRLWEANRGGSKLSCDPSTQVSLGPRQPSVFTTLSLSPEDSQQLPNLVHQDCGWVCDMAQAKVHVSDSICTCICVWQSRQVYV